MTGFEPAASWSQTRRSSQTEPHPAVFLYSFVLRCPTQDILYGKRGQMSTPFFQFFYFFQKYIFRRCTESQKANKIKGFRDFKCPGKILFFPVFRSFFLKSAEFFQKNIFFEQLRLFIFWNNMELFCCYIMDQNHKYFNSTCKSFPASASITA